ncbi:MAG: glycosyltransferase family 2 protein [Verrucomicrobiae bacterium]|nr:glycosyltransferase family 2 protein [Verrucomicrobiae bacterium]
MRLAVVIASYNHAQYLPFAIESVLNQTRKADRFLVIDDGSKDNSVDVIRSYADRGVELIVQENAGAHATWNRCIETVAQDCDLVSILNSDDIYTTNRFEKCLPRFEQPDARAMVCTGLKMIGPENEPLAEDESRAKWLRAAWALGKADGITTWEWMAMANWAVTSSNIIARCDYLVANPFQPYKFNHDYFCLSGAALRDQIALVDEVLLEYRVHPQNNINTAPAPLLKEMLRMHLDLYHHFAGELEADPAVRHRFYEYMRAAENSISSFHPGIFQLLLAQVAASVDETRLGQFIDDLDETRIAELNDYPNKALVNEWDGQSPPQLALNLAEKYQAERAARREAESEKKAWRELAKLRLELLKSRGASLARSLGFGKGQLADSGKTAEEKVKALLESQKQNHDV